MSNDNLLSWNWCNYHLLIVAWRDAELSQEIVENLRHFLWLILVNDVAYLVYNDQLEFSLHLRNCQLFVHAVTTCQQELLRDSNI